MEFKTIALALGISAASSENTVLEGITTLKLAKETAEKSVVELTKKLGEQQDAESIALVDKAVKLGLIPEGLKTIQLSAMKQDFEGSKTALTKLISEKEAEAGKNNKVQLVKEFVAPGTPAIGGAAGPERSFIQLSKENPKELIRLRNEEPEEFKRLLAETPVR